MVRTGTSAFQVERLNSIMPRRTPVLALLALLVSSAAHAQHRPMDVPDVVFPSTPARTRLILKDGSYQLVLDYKVSGSLVRYRSAERNGSTEEIPLALVDLPATQKWARDHAPGGAASSQSKDRPVLSPELAREEADRAARTPEVAPDLRLPEEDSVLVLDTFRGTPELVPLPQQGSDLNKETAHAVQKMAINPASSPHRLFEVPTASADVQIHVPDPVFYVRLGKDDEGGDPGGAFIVTGAGHPQAGRDVPTGSDERSDYVIERLDARKDSRIVDSFRIAWVGGGKGARPQPDIIELVATPLPGGHWLKLTPKVPLDFGEYALLEVLNDREINASVWDFGVHSAAPENVEALRPEPKRPVTLERRRPQ